MVASRCGLAQTRRTGRPDLADRGMSGCSRACSRRLDDGWGASQMAAFRRRPTKGSVAVARPSMGLVQAEFVALGIA